MSSERNHISAALGETLRFWWPFAVLSIVQIFVYWSKSEFALSSGVAWFEFVRKFLFDLLFFMTGILLITRVLRRDLFSVAFAALSLFLLAVDAVLFYFDRTLFEEFYLTQVSWASIQGFLLPSTFLLVGALLLLVAATGVALIRSAYSATWKAIATCSVCLLVVSLPDLATLRSKDVASAKGRQTLWIKDLKALHDLEFPEMYSGYLDEVKRQELTYCTQNSFLNFLDEMLSTLRADSFNVVKSAEPFKETIESLGLPIGKREYEKLPLKPFRKVVIFASESISLDLFSEYNPEIVSHASVFYASPEMRERMYSNYMSTTKPTLKALMTTFHSHPNFRMTCWQAFPNSLARILKDDGFQTIFLRSASKFFSNENYHFKRLGFDEIIAKEYFEEVPEVRKYVEGWGAMDRIVYMELIDILKERKEERLFVTVLGADTHIPTGRQYYADLSYPDRPDRDSEGRAFGEAATVVANHEHDMALFLEAMNEEGLLTDDTLLVFTADHSRPNDGLPGLPATPLARIPLLFVTSQTLPETDLEALASQMDLAPTILHLLNMPIPQGYWGDSLFNERREPLSLTIRQGATLLGIDTSEAVKTVEVGRSSGAVVDSPNSLFNAMILD